jgi:hypothetical protein
MDVDPGWGRPVEKEDAASAAAAKNAALSNAEAGADNFGGTLVSASAVSTAGALVRS